MICQEKSPKRQYGACSKWFCKPHRYWDYFKLAQNLNQKQQSWVIMWNCNTYGEGTKIPFWQKSEQELLGCQRLQIQMCLENPSSLGPSSARDGMAGLWRSQLPVTSDSVGLLPLGIRARRGEQMAPVFWASLPLALWFFLFLIKCVSWHSHDHIYFYFSPLLSFKCHLCF